MELTFRVSKGVKTLDAAEVSEQAKAYALACPSEFTCAFRVWYEDFEGCGMPTKPLVEAIEKGIADSGAWEHIGPHRFEKYGVVNSYRNTNYDNAAKDVNGNPMILHKFRAGGKYKGPDGKVWWIPVVELFDMRCFEMKDGVCVGEMTEINPNSDYAKALVEVQ